MSNYTYIGSELELFRDAKNWKDYYYHMIRRHLGEEILEVGAGIGGTTKALCRQSHQRWVCLEPDPMLIQAFKLDREIPQQCDIQQGTLADLASEDCFDAILYIDVLEHIEDDRSEIERAMPHLKPGGVIIVLAPAHQGLFSPFDKAIGHYRRYNKASLSQVTSDNLDNLKVVSLKYLDSVGLCASFSNRFLKQRMPTPSQIKLWDTWMVPISRRLDPLVGYGIGKSIVGIWRKD